MIQMLFANYVAIKHLYKAFTYNLQILAVELMLEDSIINLSQDKILLSRQTF